MWENVAIYLLSLLVGWTGWELHQLRAELREFVRKDECKVDMGDHCQQIRDIRAKVQENSELIARLKAYHDGR